MKTFDDSAGEIIGGTFILCAIFMAVGLLVKACG
jgi:hypothetical protein